MAKTFWNVMNLICESTNSTDLMNAKEESPKETQMQAYNLSKERMWKQQEKWLNTYTRYSYNFLLISSSGSLETRK